jgi:RNA polymerase sigma-70 factor, ECF subfamily
LDLLPEQHAAAGEGRRTIRGGRRWPSRRTPRPLARADTPRRPGGTDAPSRPGGRARSAERGWQASDIAALVALLDPDATITADGGGRAAAALHPIEGAEQIARYLADLAGHAAELTFLERAVNGQPGLVAQRDGRTVSIFAFGVAGDRISRIWVIRNPDKLRPWTTG